MKFSLKIILSFIAIGVLSLIYFSDNYFTEKKEIESKNKTFAIYFETKDVVSFSFKNKIGEFQLKREKNLSPWNLFYHQDFSADQDAVQNILAAIQQTNVQNEIDIDSQNIANDKEKLKQFGLDNPSLSIQVKLSNGKNLSLLIGKRFGYWAKAISSAEPMSVYALNPEKNKILVINNNLISVLNSKSLGDLRTKRVTNLVSEDVSFIELNSLHGHIILDKINEKWQLKSPSNWPADENSVADFLSRYQGLLAQKVIEKPEINDVLKKQISIDKPTATVIFKDSKGKVLQNLSFSLTKDGIYTAIQDGAIAKLNLDLWPDLVPLVKNFRNRIVMLNVDMNSATKFILSPNLGFIKKENNWYKVNSVNQQPAVSETPNKEAMSFFSNFELMSANDIIENPSKNDLEKFGFSKPLKDFTLYFSDDSKQKPIQIFIGNRVPNDEKNVYLKRSDSPHVYIVETGWLASLAQLYSVGDSSKPQQ